MIARRLTYSAFKTPVVCERYGRMPSDFTELLLLRGRTQVLYYDTLADELKCQFRRNTFIGSVVRGNFRPPCRGRVWA